MNRCRHEIRRAKVLLALLGIGALAGAPCIAEAQGPQKDVLRVGTSGDYAPFSMAYGTRGGSTWKPQGLDIAVAEAYAKDRGLEIEWVQFRWPELRRDLAGGRFDVAMSGITQRPERSLIGRYTVPIATAGAIALVRDAKRFRTVDDLNREGVRIAVNQGGHLERVTRTRFPRATIITVSKNDNVPKQLFEGKADAVVTDTLEAPHWQLGARGVVRRGPFSHDLKSYLVSLSRPELAADIDRWLIENEADGTLNHLRRVHLGRIQRPQPAAPLMALLASIDERLALMPLIAETKRSRKREIEDQKREEKVIREATVKTQEAARSRGVTPPTRDALHRFFVAQIEAAKAIQHLASKNAEAGSATPLDLEADLRPAIDRISDRMSGLLTQLPADLDTESARRQVHQVLDFHGLTEKQLDAIAESLVELAHSTRRQEFEAVPNRVLSQ